VGRPYRSEGIVLRGRDYGEADRILTIFTRTSGKVRAVAKGVLKPKSRLRSGVQPLSRTDFALYQGRGELDTVTQCELLEPYGAIKSDLDRLGQAVCFAELVDEITPERQPDEEVYLLMVKGLELLSWLEPQMAARILEIRLLNATGYRPDLEHCGLCGARWSGLARFNPRYGVVCANCGGKEGGIPLSQGLKAVWERFGDFELSRISRLKISPAELELLGRMTRAYLEFILERESRSARVFASLQSSLH